MRIHTYNFESFYTSYIAVIVVMPVNWQEKVRASTKKKAQLLRALIQRTPRQSTASIGKDWFYLMEFHDNEKHNRFCQVRVSERMCHAQAGIWIVEILLLLGKVFYERFL